MKNSLHWARHAWALGFALVTFDRVLTFDLFDYTVKSSYFCFLTAFLLLLCSQVGTGVSASLRTPVEKIFGFFKQSPWIFLVLLLAYSFGMGFRSEMPWKATAYSIWLTFDLVVVVYPGVLLFSPALNLDQSRRELYGLWLKYLVAAMVGLAIVVQIDYVAHFYGYREGLIGFNQGISDWYAYSRPHGFSFEPSYLSLFFIFGMVFLIFEAIVTKEPLIPRWLSLLSLVLSLNVLIFTFARSTLISFGMILVVLMGLFLFSKRRLPVRLLWVFTAGFLCCCMLILLTPKEQIFTIYDRMIYRAVRGEDASLDARLRGFRVSYQMAANTHYLGTGMGNSYNYWFKYLEGYDSSLPPDATYKTRQIVANIWLEVFAEMGIPGLILLFCFVIGLLAKAYRAMRLAPESLAFIGFTSCLVFFLFTAHWFPNVCRTDMWVWVAIWTVGTMPRLGETPSTRSSAA